MIASNGGGFPSSVVSRRISGVKLELVIFIVACKQEGSTERPWTTDLSVVLLDIADVNDDFFDGDVWSVLELVILRVRQKILERILWGGWWGNWRRLRGRRQRRRCVCRWGIFFKIFCFIRARKWLRVFMWPWRHLPWLRYLNERRCVPIEEPVLLMASMAYSICWSLPSGVNVVVFESYFRDILKFFQITKLNFYQSPFYESFTSPFLFYAL